LRAVDLSGNKSDFTSSVNATTLLIEPNDFNDAVNDLFQEAGAFGIEPVDSLPASGDFDGQLKLLKSNITIYRWDSTTSTWSTDLYTASNVEAGTITAGSFAEGIEPVSIVDTLPSPTGYTGPSVVFLTTDNKLYRYDGTSFTAATSTQDLTGTLGAGLFSNELRPIERVASLPTTSLTQGRVVLLTTDNKLYRYTGSAWTANIAASDLTGQLSGTQIADGAITTTKITDDAVVTAKIAANAITANEIASNAVTAAKISAGSVSADKIATNAITAVKVAADAITAGTIAAGAISASSLFVDGVVSAAAVATDAIVADKIAAGSIISSKIGAGAVTAEKISVSELSAISADLGSIIVDTANIADAAITNAKISDLSADKINTGSLSADFISIDGVTLDTSGGELVIKSGGVTTSFIGADSVTSSTSYTENAPLTTLSIGGDSRSLITVDYVPSADAVRLICVFHSAPGVFPFIENNENEDIPSEEDFFMVEGGNVSTGDRGWRSDGGFGPAYLIGSGKFLSRNVAGSSFYLQNPYNNSNYNFARALSIVGVIDLEDSTNYPSSGKVANGRRISVVKPEGGTYVRCVSGQPMGILTIFEVKR
jgi:hypothetical protein